MATTRLTKPQQILEKVNQSAKLVAVKMPVIFILKDSDKNMRHINPFYVQKALDSIAGKVKNKSWLKNGHNDKHAVTSETTLLGSHLSTPRDTSRLIPLVESSILML
jgi:hypothetical protein